MFDSKLHVFPSKQLFLQICQSGSVCSSQFYYPRIYSRYLFYWAVSQYYCEYALRQSNCNTKGLIVVTLSIGRKTHMNDPIKQTKTIIPMQCRCNRGWRRSKRQAIADHLISGVLDNDRSVRHFPTRGAGQIIRPPEFLNFQRPCYARIIRQPILAGYASRKYYVVLWCSIYLPGGKYPSKESIIVPGCLQRSSNSS